MLSDKRSYIHISVQLFSHGSESLAIINSLPSEYVEPGSPIRTLRKIWYHTRACTKIIMNIHRCSVRSFKMKLYQVCGPRKQWFWNKDYRLQREIEFTVTAENIKHCIYWFSQKKVKKDMFLLNYMNVYSKLIFNTLAVIYWYTD